MGGRGSGRYIVNDNHINIYNNTQSLGRVNIVSRNDFFKNLVHINIQSDRIIFESISIFESKKESTFCKVKEDKEYPRYSCTLTIPLEKQIDTGKYPIDEDESNEDQLVIYFEDKID